MSRELSPDYGGEKDNYVHSQEVDAGVKKRKKLNKEITTMPPNSTALDISFFPAFNSTSVLDTMTEQSKTSGGYNDFEFPQTSQPQKDQATNQGAINKKRKKSKHEEAKTETLEIPHKKKKRDKHKKHGKDVANVLSTCEGELILTDSSIHIKKKKKKHKAKEGNEKLTEKLSSSTECVHDPLTNQLFSQFRTQAHMNKKQNTLDAMSITESVKSTFSVATVKLIEMSQHLENMFPQSMVRPVPWKNSPNSKLGVSSDNTSNFTRLSFADKFNDNFINSPKASTTLHKSDFVNASSISPIKHRVNLSPKHNRLNHNELDQVSQQFSNKVKNTKKDQTDSAGDKTKDPTRLICYDNYDAPVLSKSDQQQIKDNSIEMVPCKKKKRKLKHDSQKETEDEPVKKKSHVIKSVSETQSEVNSENIQILSKSYCNKLKEEKKAKEKNKNSKKRSKYQSCSQTFSDFASDELNNAHDMKIKYDSLSHLPLTASTSIFSGNSSFSPLKSKISLGFKHNNEKDRMKVDTSSKENIDGNSLNHVKKKHNSSKVLSESDNKEMKVSVDSKKQSIGKSTSKKKDKKKKNQAKNEHSNFGDTNETSTKITLATFALDVHKINGTKDDATKKAPHLANSDSLNSVKAISKPDKNEMKLESKKRKSKNPVEISKKKRQKNGDLSPKNCLTSIFKVENSSNSEKSTELKLPTASVELSPNNLAITGKGKQFSSPVQSECHSKRMSYKTKKKKSKFAKFKSVSEIDSSLNSDESNDYSSLLKFTAKETNDTPLASSKSRLKTENNSYTKKGKSKIVISSSDSDHDSSDNGTKTIKSKNIPSFDITSDKTKKHELQKMKSNSEGKISNNSSSTMKYKKKKEKIKKNSEERNSSHFGEYSDKANLSNKTSDPTNNKSKTDKSPPKRRNGPIVLYNMKDVDAYITNMLEFDVKIEDSIDLPLSLTSPAKNKQKLKSGHERTENTKLERDDLYYTLSDEECALLRYLTVELDFEVPELHKIERGLMRFPLKQQCDQITALGAEVKKGNYSPEENQIVRDNWTRFCKTHNIPAKPQLFMNLNIKDENKKQILPKEEGINFVKYLARGLPNRLLYSVYKRFRTIYSTVTRGYFTPEEDKILMDVVETSKNCHHIFERLGKDLNRTALSLHKRYCWLRDQNRHNYKSERINHQEGSVIVKKLMQHMKVKQVNQMKYLHIPFPVFTKIGEELRLRPLKIQQYWYYLHPKLFVTGDRAMWRVKTQLIDLILTHPEWKTLYHVKYNEFIPYMDGWTTFALGKLLRNMIRTAKETEMYRDKADFRSLLAKCKKGLEERDSTVLTPAIYRDGVLTVG